MKLKKISLVLLFVMSLVLLCGCGKESESSTNSENKTPSATRTPIVENGFDLNGTGTLNCKTEAYAGEGIDVDLSYVVKYANGNVLELRSVAKITSSAQENLDEYETAYRNIANNYEGLKYYDTSLTRGDDTITYDTIIQYDKIDINKLLDIEGEEDNIVVNGSAKLSLWLDLAEQVGTICEEA